MQTTQLEQVVEARRRKLYTGSPEARLHEYTDAQLRRVVADPAYDAYEKARWDRYVRSAQAELDWRREAGLSFGWTRV